MSITQSSRPVKVAGKLFGAKQSGWLRIYRIHLGIFEGVQKTEETLYVTPRLMRIERQAKALAPWAGVTYRLTEITAAQGGQEASHVD